MEKPILVHACCGPCSTASIERLLKEGWKPTIYFGNSNIFPKEEADKRYEELMKVVRKHNLEVIRDQWDHAAWLTAIAGYEGEPEHGQRCTLCFAYNLAQASEKAKELGFEHFTTTLTVSRFKNSKTIFTVGAAFEGFEPIDFKKQDGFSKSVALSIEMGIYRQQYCGCEFSISR